MSRTTPAVIVWHVLAALVLLSAPEGRSLAAADGAPKVLVIVADDLGYGDLGFQGAKDIPTPHLDALARSGVRCTSGYVTHPFCSPTRAGLLTGRYQQRFGHENNPTWLPEDATVGLPLSETTLAQALKGAGYATGAVGKWHLGAHPQFHPCARGFDEYFGLRGGGHHYFEHNLFLTDPARAERVEYQIPLHRNREPVAENEYLTDALGREASAFVTRHKGEPWFLYLTFNAPHTPLQAPPKYLDRAAGIADTKRRTYAAMIMAMDDAIGRVLAAVRESGAERDTLVFFISDNGGPEGVNGSDNGPLRGSKGSVFEGGMRVPYLVRWPARLKPGVYDRPVSSLDVFATCVALAGAKPRTAGPLDGVNLIPYLTGERSEPPHDRLFWRTGGGEQFAAREGRWKLIGGRGKASELYDLEADLAESHDLAATHPEVREALLKDYERWNSGLVDPKWENPQPAPPPAAKKAER
jgi:arylsulfatase A-like enzyme